MAVKNRIVRLAAWSIAVLLQGMAAAQAPPKPNVPDRAQDRTARFQSLRGSDTQATVGQGGDMQIRQERRNLSEKLARSDGVICPPAQIDPEIRAPTPPGGAMPVIPPPGSPGGDQSVQPK